ncbi:MAG TPA: apolipoprotein N-acyltransferase [Steroidobacteraceae bacterium]|nr:apolipoprotein N-acyltransferase [Steroidobacteraceae bacterium]
MAEQPAAARNRIRAGRLLALLGGVALSFAFAPFGQWWLALAAPAVLMALWARSARPGEGAWLGFCFGLGLYASGTWWLYISIRIIGQAPVVVALLVMLALVLIMAAYQALLGYLVCRWLRPGSLGGRLLWVPAAWVLVEWWRGWFLTGFPWLSLGYSQTDTWLAGLAPVGGVPLTSFSLLAGAGALLVLAQERGAARAVALVALVLPWTSGLALRGVEWTHPAGEARSVAILQGAIPQDMKWQVSNSRNILDTYERLHRDALGADLIVWPESALPDVANRFSSYIANVWSAAGNRGSHVLMGVMRVEVGETEGEDRYYNSILGLGAGDPAFYDKRQLVPFGEFFPVPGFVRRWLRLMNLPYSDFTVGARHQRLFELAGVQLATSICYEDAYPGLLRRETLASGAMVTVTNDAWFGHSPARYQHLQISRMRALEARRYLVRAANDGVSAVVAPDGRVVARASEYEPQVLRGEFTPREGATPYLATGNLPVLGLALLLVAVPVAGGLRNRRRGAIDRLPRA